METRLCIECGEYKGLEDNFLKQGGKDKNARYNQCKACRYIKTKIRHEINPGWRNKYKQRERKYSLDYYYERLKGTEAFAIKRREDQKRYRLKYPKKCKAKQKLGNAVRDGRVNKMPCIVCGNPISEGHHDDYDKPFEVRWLCTRHHNDFHLGELEVAL